MIDTLDFIRKKYDKFEDSDIIELGVGREDGLAPLLDEIGFNIGAEIGTESGKFAERLCRCNPNLKLFCVDAYESYGDYRLNYSLEKNNKAYEIAKERLKSYNYEIIKKYSMDAVKDFADESLDFVFIDGNHEIQSVINDIAEWSKKVKKGGIVAGHDYWKNSSTTENKHCREYIHCKDAINAWVSSYDIKPLFILNGSKGPSWMYIKN